MNSFVIVFALLLTLLVIKFVISRIIGDYRKRARVMNNSERELYLILQRELGDKFIILSKIRIEDFVDGGRRYETRNRIQSKHVDFLICDLKTTEPLCAIELDGSSHFEDNRIERDMFVNNLYKKIKLPIVHIKVGSNFYDEVENIKRLLN